MKKLILLPLITPFFLLTSCSKDDKDKNNAPPGNYHISIQTNCYAGTPTDYCVTKQTFDRINKSLETAQQCPYISFQTLGGSTKGGYYYSSSYSGVPCENM